ncbi:nucleotidyltransferase domain-containing protein [Pseudomonas sp. L1(2025)]|uniref:nucleotidyltransferase domain-containing protein n=1 Tax=Pseudomonas sp. L1(2025) TaxID=3449429 RepID=UPI003F690DA0
MNAANIFNSYANKVLHRRFLHHRVKNNHRSKYSFNLRLPVGSVLLLLSNHIKNGYVMNNLSALRDALAFNNIDSANVVPLIAITEHTPIVLFVGSLQQGFGTPTSDIDFLVVYPHGCSIVGLESPSVDGADYLVDISAEGDSSFPTDYSLIINRRTIENYKVQLTLTTATHIEAIQRVVSERNQSILRRVNGVASERQRRGKMLDRPAQLLLHRFYTGLALQNAEALQVIRNKVPYQVFIDNIGIRETSAVRSWISDVHGLAEANVPCKRETLVFITYRVLIHLSSLVLSSVGEIAPQEKLLFRLLDRHRQTIGAGIVDTLLTAANDVGAVVDSGTDKIIELATQLPLLLSGLSPLVKQEIVDWEQETTFKKFE